MTELVIETERLRLRPFRAADLPAFLAYRNDEEVARYQGWNVPYTPEQAEEFLREQQNLPLKSPGEWRQLVIERKADGLVLGDCALKLGRDEQQAEVGCTLARAHWRAGYGVEASRGLLQYLFNELKLHRVYANCDVLNLAAAQTLEQLGMRREAHYVENLWFKGRWSSEYWYAILDREWNIISHGAPKTQLSR